MKRKSGRLLPLLRQFFEIHLKVDLGVSLHTLRAYRDAWRLFMDYLVEHQGLGRASDLLAHDVERKRVLDFLRFIEESRGCCVRTRNQRLAAFRAFAKFVNAEHPAWENHFTRILRIPQKRYRKRTIDYLETNELHCLLKQVRRGTDTLLRDFTLLVYAYNTGARADEIAHTRLDWLHIEKPPLQVRLWGKGGRQRIVPLWPATVQLLQRYIRLARPRSQAGSEAFLFLNRQATHFTRFGVAKLFRRYLVAARREMLSLKQKRLSIHSMRHTTAVHLLQSGCELNVIKAWLGHASIATTEIYTEINLDNKRSLLERFITPDYVTHFLAESPTQNEPDLDWLNRI